MTRDEYLLSLQRLGSSPTAQYPTQEVQGRVPERLLTNPGKLIQLGGRVNNVNYSRNGSVYAEANDPLLNEWGVYVYVLPESIQLLSDAAVVWGVTMKIQASYDSANIDYYHPLQSNTPLPVPLTGVAIPVHGQRIQVEFKRSAVAEATGTAQLIVAVIPRLPGPAPDPRSSLVALENPFAQNIPTMTRSLQIMTAVSAGDQLIFRDPADTVIATFNMASEFILRPIPIFEGAVRVQYNAVDIAPKPITIEFTTWL